MNRLNIIHETYFGKTPEVLKIERIIQQYKNKYHDSVYSAQLTTDPLKYELGKAIEDAFGFEICDITIEPTANMNACTFPIGYKLDTIPGKNLIVTSKHGYKYKKEAGYCLVVTIFAGLLLSPDLSAAEVTAVLLHEIGHNFTPAAFAHQSILQKIRIISKVAVIIAQYGAAGAGVIFQVTNLIDRITIKIRQTFARVFPSFTEFIHSIESIFGAVNDIGQFIMELSSAFNPVSNAIWIFLHSMYSAMLDPISVFVGNTDENFADSFATMYGYGEELSSALSKMDTRATLFRSSIKESSFMNNLYHTSLIPIYLVVSIFDEHSQSCVRSVKILEQLEYEVEHGNHSPKFKKRIKQDIKKVKESINNAYYEIKDSDPETSQKLWAQFVLSNGCYKLYSAILNRATPETIDLISKEKINEFDKIKFK